MSSCNALLVQPFCTLVSTLEERRARPAQHDHPSGHKTRHPQRRFTSQHNPQDAQYTSTLSTAHPPAPPYSLHCPAARFAHRHQDGCERNSTKYHRPQHTSDFSISFCVIRRLRNTKTARLIWGPICDRASRARIESSPVSPLGSSALDP